MDRGRIFVSWLFAALFVFAALGLHGKIAQNVSWSAFTLFLLIPAGIHRPKIAPVLERFLNYYWIGVVAFVGVMGTGYFHSVSKYGPWFLFACTLGFVAIWIYRDIVFLRLGPLQQHPVHDELNPPSLGRISATLPNLCEEFGVPSLGVAVTNGGGRLDWIAVTGKRRIDAEDKVTTSDKFHLGSCGKSMTATLAALLVEEGILDWKLTLGDFFRNVKIHPDYTSATVEQLLCHRGGVPSDLSPNGLWTSLWQHHGTPMEQRAYLVEKLLCSAPKYRPGTEYLYSNAGFAIVGAIIEQLLGQSWESSIKSRLFQPLGMTSTGFGAPGHTGKNDEPLGHLAKEGQPPFPVEPGPKADNPPAIAPSGGIHCTLADWSRYAAFHLSGRAQSDTIRLSPSTLQKLHTPEGDSEYAFGWILAERPWAHGLALNHGGSNTMFYAVIWIAPKRDFAAMAVTNMGGTRAFKACDQAISNIIMGGSVR